MIVWLASFPRSGNTLFRLVLKHIYSVSSYSIYDDLLLDRIGASETIGHLHLPSHLGLMQRSKDLFFVKTHKQYGAEYAVGKRIYLIRDGRDAVVSTAHFERDFGDAGKQSFKEVLREVVSQTNWSQHVFSWLPHSSILRFKDLVRNPCRVVQAALQRADINLKPICSILPTFKELHTKWPKFFRRGEVGTWHSEMHISIQREFEEKHSDALTALGYMGTEIP